MRTYQYKDKTFDRQRDMVKALLDVCYDQRRPNAFYLSRSFDIIDSDGNGYTLSYRFDRDEILQAVKFELTSTAQQTAAKTTPKPYTLYATNYVDCCGEKIATNEDVMEYLKQHEGEKFTLQKDGGDRLWVQYQDGILIYDGKKYAAKY